MSRNLEFTAAIPAAVAPQLDSGVVHLWRIRHAPQQGRGPLLKVLSAYLGAPASTIALDQDAHGKPHLVVSAQPRPAHRSFEFNWSHSGDYALIAVAWNLPLGVDIERFGKRLRAVELAQRFFDPAEAAALANGEPSGRSDSFIRLWCAKEAVLKAAGEGLSFGLARLAFRRVTCGAWALARTDPALGPAGDWQLAAFEPVPGYYGSLAWRGPPMKIVALRPAVAKGDGTIVAQ